MKALAVADDLSGAAEVAGVAWRMGMATVVSTSMHLDYPSETEVVAADADSRSKTEKEAAEIWREWGERAAAAASPLFYKKIDSVLRGHLSVELKACLDAGPWMRALVVPANPERGRVVRDGFHRVKGTALEQTEFARDQRFPLRSSRVEELVTDSVSVKARRGLKGLGPTKIAVGDTETIADLRAWAAVKDQYLLRAGASPFFAELLRGIGGSERMKAATPELPETGGTWLVSGSASERAVSFTERLEIEGWPVVRSDETPVLPGTPQLLVARHPRQRSSEPPGVLTERLARVVEQLLRSKPGVPPHLCLEGGETAAAVLKKLGKASLSLLREWEPGVVTLKADGLLVTIKPGSYPWPPDLLKES